MSEASLGPYGVRESVVVNQRTKVRQLARLFWLLLSSPARAFLSLRRSMTGASASLLVMCIVTLNIIWGYPWIGMFSACLSMMVLGWVIHRLMRPQLSFGLSLPCSSPAGQPVSVLLHSRNAGRLPAMDLRIDFLADDKRQRRSMMSRWQQWRSRFHDGPRYRVLSAAQVLPLIEPGHQVSLRTTIAFDRRGIHPLPDVLVTSSFPFHLFRSVSRHSSQTQIAITPRPLSGDEDPVARGLLDALGSWSHRLLSGDALDYTGSREYQTGMPVRRWDFTSWARLGRPIVREFQSPSIQLVNLIVDTSCDGSDSSDAEHADPMLERLLSLAATAVLSLGRRMVRVRLFLTSEVSQSQACTAPMMSSESQPMLIRLAAADNVASQLADSRIAEALDLVGRTPTLILTSRADVSHHRALPAGVTVLNLDPAHRKPGATVTAGADA